MKLLISMVVVLATMLVMAGDVTRAYGYRRGARVHETICVVDQNGKPVTDALVYGALTTGGWMNDYALIKGMTDSNGQFQVRGKCTDFMRCQIVKAGYYTTEFRVSYLDTKAVPAVKDGRWQPYGNKRVAVLKEIVDPQPMVCRDLLASLTIPKYSVWMGFDFERYDFVAPYGKGRDEDVLLRFNLDRPSADECNMTMEVAFTNRPYAGAYKMMKDEQSEFKTAYEADTNRHFGQSFTYRFQRRKGKPPSYDRLQEDEYLVYRTRTRVDRDGNLVSAHYGVICGGWDFVGPAGFRIADFIFNPRPNDIRLESTKMADYSRKCQRQWVELMQ